MVTLIAVQSSNVAAYAYLSEYKVLLVAFKDGALYARSGVSEEMARDFATADSKGRFLANLTAPSVCILKSTGQQPADTPAPATRQAANPQLQTYQEDDCCGRALFAFLSTPDSEKTKTWTHPKCGQEWRPRIQGILRHWSPVCVTSVMRGRR